MSFSQVLKEVTDGVKGARGAAVVGMDGIVVEGYAALGEADGVDLQSLGAEYGNILKNVQDVSQSLHMGRAREVAVVAEATGLIMRKINDDYFLALLISPGGNLGKGRFIVRKAVNRLMQEF